MLTFSYRNKKESRVFRRPIRIQEKIFGLNPVRGFVAMLVFMEHSQIDIIHTHQYERFLRGAAVQWSSR